MSEPLLKLVEGGRRIGDRWLFRSLNLEVREGDRILLEGASGSGKTSLLRCLSTLDKFDEGELSSSGRTPTCLPQWRNQIMYAHQNPAIFPGTVWDNLVLPYSLKINEGRAPSRSKVAGALSVLGGSSDLLDQPITHVSGGERQIMAILRAVFLGPKLLLLDEPTSAMDSELATKVADWVCETEISFIWISHHGLIMPGAPLRRWELKDGLYER